MDADPSMLICTPFHLQMIGSDSVVAGVIGEECFAADFFSDSYEPCSIMKDGKVSHKRCS